nr:elongation factor G [Desulfobacterales bacterium]
MSEKIERLRNIGLIAHGGSGKTSLAEAILFNAGVTNRLGRVDQGNSVMDFDPEELKRQITISTSFNQYEWNGHRVNIMDTPGDANFFNDTISSIQCADGAVVLVDAIDGVKVQTEKGWEFADKFQLPRIIFINKMDRERADFFKTLEDISENLKPKSILLQVPIGAEDSFQGVVDLIDMKAYLYIEGKSQPTDIPGDIEDIIASEREKFIEKIAEADDTLLEKYLEGEEITDDEIRRVLREGTLNRVFVPVLCGSATKNIGIDLLMDAINYCLPSPLDRGNKKGTDPKTGDTIERAPRPDEPFSAFVFKTLADPYAGQLSIFRIYSGIISPDGTFYNANKQVKERYGQLFQVAGKEQKPIKEAGPGDIIAVAKLKETTTGDTLCDETKSIIFKGIEPLPTLISYAIQPKAQGDEEKIFSALSRLLDEDPALKVTRDNQTKEIIISGMGEGHIEVTVEKLKRKFNVDVILSPPKVPYKETIKGKVRVQGKYKKQSGGRGQYGDAWIEMEPLPRGSGFEFVDKIVGGVIPKQYIPAVEKGILEASEKGVLAGYPCVDFKVSLVDGSFHTVDSSELAFKIAGSMAFKKGAEAANPVLLEPIMEVEITVPEENMGDIIGDLNGRRGRVLGMESKGKNQVIKAQVPMAEFLTYAPNLRSMTGGRGVYTMQFSHYEEVPPQISQKIIEEAKRTKEEG